MAALVKYKYLGLSSVVEVDYPTPQVKLDLHGGTSGTYTGLDRFGRVINHPWINYDTDEDVARIQHGYDRNSNRLWRQNDVARALSKKFDQQYTYDGLNRLTDAKTGLFNGSHVIPSGGDTKFQQQWSLDYVGNWSCFKQNDDGSGSFELEQTRTADQVLSTALIHPAGPNMNTTAEPPLKAGDPLRFLPESRRIFVDTRRRVCATCDSRRTFTRTSFHILRIVLGRRFVSAASPGRMSTSTTAGRCGFTRR